MTDEATQELQNLLTAHQEILTRHENNLKNKEEGILTEEDYTQHYNSLFHTIQETWTNFSKENPRQEKTFNIALERLSRIRESAPEFLYLLMPTRDIFGENTESSQKNTVKALNELIIEVNDFFISIKTQYGLHLNEDDELPQAAFALSSFCNYNNEANSIHIDRTAAKNYTKDFLLQKKSQVFPKNNLSI